MANSINNNTSTMGLALAGNADAVKIPKPSNHSFWNGKESFAAVAARSLSNTTKSAALPTPPNSISPSLPPTAYKGRGNAVPPTPPAQALVESDIDLLEEVEHARAQDHFVYGASTPGYGDAVGRETIGAITSGLLVKHHLPEILLNRGAMPIREIMGHLTISVPGFSGIPPARARRLVVRALEAGALGGEENRPYSDVLFEKVGWGKWEAKSRPNYSKSGRSVRRQSPVAVRHERTMLRSPSPYATRPVRIPRNSHQAIRNRLSSNRSISRLTVDSNREHNSDISMRDHETEADKMSLDGSSGASSGLEEDVIEYEDDLTTDSEDWASIGPEALLSGSYRSNRAYTPHSHTHIDNTSLNNAKIPQGGGSLTRIMANSAPAGAGKRTSGSRVKVVKLSTLVQDKDRRQRLHYAASSSFPMEGIGELQEREAVEALIRLGSV